MGRSLVFCHPSDEHYGADRVLLDIWESLPADQRADTEVWLPTDLPHGSKPLCRELRTRGAVVRHVDLPIVRRAYLTPIGLARVLRRWWRLQRALRKQRPDVVYCTTSAAFLCAPAARFAGVPEVVGHVQEVWGSRDAVLLSGAARFCGQLLTISEAVRAALPPTLQRRATVVRNATPDPGPVPPPQARAGALRFVIAGRWTPIKGHATLLRAWDLAGSPGELVILGGPGPIGRSVDVSGLVAGLRRPETVRIEGEVDDIGPYLEEADVVVIPSDRPEGFGLTAVEAFARGRPVVGSSFGGIAEIVHDGVNGWLFTPGDHERLGEILGSLAHEDVLRAGRRAREDYERLYTPSRYAREWQAALELPRPGAGAA